MKTISQRMRWYLCYGGLCALSAFAFGCGDDGAETVPAAGALDDEDASFGFGKADGDNGGFSACQLREVLKFVNETTTTAELLTTQAGVHSRAANALIAHRLGPDGKEGTRDDDLFDDLAELDGVKNVGPKALEAFAAFAGPRCVDDLSKRPFISEETFKGATGGGFGLNAPEFEATFAIDGPTGHELFDVLNSTDDRGRTIFSRVRKSELMEAFTYNYNVDEMPWDGDSTDAREAVPYLALSIESGRFEIDEGDGTRELNLGTDTFDDIYYDTKDYELLSLGMVLRGRVRWDNETTVRRLLIQAKSASSIDANGIKSAAKVDVRTEGDRHKATLDNDVRSGTVPWTGSRVALEPVKTVYDELAKAGRLKDIDGNKGVLLLDPKANLRSLRSRFHFNLAGRTELGRFFDNGVDRIQFSRDMAQAALDDGTVESGDRADVEAMITFADSVLDNTLIEQRAMPRLMALDPPVDTIKDHADAFDSISASSFEEVDVAEIVAEETDQAWDELADMIDDVDRAITGTRGLDGDDYVDMYVAFVKFERSNLKAKQTYKPFLERYEEVNTGADADITAHRDAFTAFAKQQKDSGDDDFEDFEELTDEIWANLGAHLRFEALKISQRMIHNAGTSAKAQWFHIARQLHVPSAFASSFSNFIIDTLDVTYFITPEIWETIGGSMLTPADMIEAKSIFHAGLVNEVQIELTSISPYSDRVEALTAEIAANPDPAKERELAGAKFILDESIRTLQLLGELKGDDIVDRLEDEGLKDVEWGPARFSKGQTALRILSDTD